LRRVSKKAKPYAISLFSPFSLQKKQQNKTQQQQQNQYKKYYKKFGKQISRRRSERSHDNRPVNFSPMFDLATAALANQDQGY
jgi:hypothetical protein